MTDAERFWTYIERSPGCWLWGGTVHKTTGYGVFSTRGPAPRTRMAHRFAYELVKGPIPTGLVIDHLCRVRACVNPDHLEAVTQRENVHRSEGPGGRWRDTHCKRGHEFTPANTRIDRRRGTRQCRECYRQAMYDWTRTHRRKVAA